MKQLRFDPIKPYDSSKDKESWWWPIYRYTRWQLPHLYRDIKQGISNMVAYAPLIWRDRDWDYEFLYRMLLFKMKRMQPAIRVMSAPSDYHAALDRCVVLLEEVNNRSQCNCSYLGTKECGVEQHISCNKLQQEMLKEFGKLFSRYSQGWWD
jgi:hypothetical protein